MGRNFALWLTFNGLIHRLTQIPLRRSAFHKELINIKHLARVNDVQVDIDRMVRKQLIRKKFGFDYLSAAWVKPG